MGIFAAWGRQSATAPSHGRESPTSARGGTMGLPVGFEAVGEAIAEARCPLAACEAVGREAALDGASVDEALAGLRQAWQAVLRDDPPYDAVATLVGAWSEATLSVVSHISCEDPMTGLSSVAHMRSSLALLYRGHRQGAPHPRDSHALVVVDLPQDRHGGESSGDPIGRAMRMATLGEAVRTVFAGQEVIGRVSANRVAVLAERDARLGVRARLLRRFVEGVDTSGYDARVWIEGLPASDLASGLLLDELARS